MSVHGQQGNSFSATKLRPRLQLIRLPNLFTAMADVLAGYLIVTGAAVRWDILLPLLLATACLYAAGCVLNDFHDREIDRRERPFRPIPSGGFRPGKRRFSPPSFSPWG